MDSSDSIYSYTIFDVQSLTITYLVHRSIVGVSPAKHLGQTLVRVYMNRCWQTPLQAMGNLQSSNVIHDEKSN